MELGKPHVVPEQEPRRDLSDFIVTIDGLVDPEICEELIAQYASRTEPALVEGNVRHPSRTCSQLHTSKAPCADLELLLRAYAKKATILYRRQFPTCRIDQDTGWLYLRYDEGQFYKQHVDAFPGEQRVLTISIALNENFEGGEWAWFDRGIMKRFKTGDAVLFPSNFMFPHEITPVRSGTRHAIITWFKG